MTGFPFLAVSFFLNFIAVLFVICCVILILIILVQKGKGGGLGGAFGGGMAGGLLGSKTGDFLTWVTIVLVGIMLFLAIVLAKYYKPPGWDTNDTGTQQSQPLVPSGTTEAEPEIRVVDQESEETETQDVISDIPITEDSTLPGEDTGTVGESTSENIEVNLPGN